MALSNLGRRNKSQNAEEATKYDEKKSVDGNGSPSDVEGGNPPRRMSRIDAPPGGEYDSESTFDIGAQLELEKDNAIQYRTCSWQKVRNSCPL